MRGPVHGAAESSAVECQICFTLTLCRHRLKLRGHVVVPDGSRLGLTFVHLLHVGLQRRPALSHRSAYRVEVLPCEPPYLVRWINEAIVAERPTPAISTDVAQHPVPLSDDERPRTVSQVGIGPEVVLRTVAVLPCRALGSHGGGYRHEVEEFSADDDLMTGIESPG